MSQGHWDLFLQTPKKICKAFYLFFWYCIFDNYIAILNPEVSSLLQTIIVSGLPLLRSFSFTLLLFDVEGLPGISLWALVVPIVGAMVCCSIKQVLNDLIYQSSYLLHCLSACAMTIICSVLTFFSFYMTFLSFVQ